jgi:ADP-heptose:LPS heptosyltransferase
MKLLLRNCQCPGDVLMLTAVVRDLHRTHPGRFLTAVDTPCGDLWLHNPHVTALAALGQPDRVLDCEYPLIHQSNQRPFHFIHGMALDLEAKLRLRIPISAFKGDIHLSEDERRMPSPLAALGYNGPFWIIVAGGKSDFTAKWWNPDSYQTVVDHFRGRRRFVQCGEAGHWHPPLTDAINLIGKTSLRQFVHLMYHADGVFCPVTFAMHLAAAVPLRPGQINRACVVVAGGREPSHWESYPGHQFLHTQGALDCCATGGCWKSRCQVMNDGDARDHDLCTKPVQVKPDLHIPRCMDLITPRRVIEAIELYYQGGALKYLPPGERT